MVGMSGILQLLFILGFLQKGDCSIQGGLSFSDILPEDPKMYDKMKPPKKDGKPTKVSFHVTVMGLDSINEGSMKLILKLKHAKQIFFEYSQIIFLVKSRKLTLTLSCAMNFATYPHDTQKCSLQMESLSYTTDDLLFDWEEITPLVVDENIELPQLDLIKTERGDCTQVYSTGNFTCLQVVFTLRRRLGYYLFHTYIPTCLIVIMSWVSFWIKPEAVPARVTLGVTSLLTLSTQHAKSQSALPPVSYIKAIDIFMSSCTFFVFLSLMEYALVNIVLDDEAETLKQMTNENKMVFNLQPRLMNAVQKRRLLAHMIDRISRILFPLIFVLLNIWYWVYYTQYQYLSIA
ncbi:glycine receptor subunit alpha-2 [Parasteatoda tepidariorum]|uniref:glycine receptor subunit alpha-2 n=1 Tax=Parasteatoda tepidariorum TaxID=114398 RepID=UPI0039BC55AD